MGGIYNRKKTHFAQEQTHCLRWLKSRMKQNQNAVDPSQDLNLKNNLIAHYKNAEGFCKTTLVL